MSEADYIAGMAEMEMEETMSDTPQEGGMSKRTKPIGGLMTEQQAAAYTGHTVSAYRKWRYKGGGPQYAKLGSSVRYRRRDLDAWIEENIVSNTSEAS